MSTPNITRWLGMGLLGLPLYGALTFFSALNPQPNTHLEAWSRYVTTNGYVLKHLFGSILGVILAIFGVFALGAYLTRSRDRGELRAKLAKLQKNRETAEREIAAIEAAGSGWSSRSATETQLWSTTRARCPSLSTTSAPRSATRFTHQVYKMLRLEVLTYPDKSLEVSGAILAREEIERGGPGASEPTRTSGSQNTQSLAVRFRATLGEEPEVELALV